MKNREHFFKLSLVEKRAYLAEKVKTLNLSKAENEAPNPFPIVVPDLENRFEPFPLTDIQESYLVGKQLGNGMDKVGCHIYAEIEVPDLDIARLNEAWNQLISHHEMLRTVIMQNGTQRILQSCPRYECRVIRISTNEGQGKADQIARLRDQMSHKIYVADQWPFFEICISQSPGYPQVIHFSIDGWLVDGASVLLLLEQWYQLYHQPQTKLITADLSFRDYILAQRKFEQSQAFQTGLDYWKKKLEQLPPGPSFPKNDRLSNGASPAYRRIRLQQEISSEDYQRMKVKAKLLGVSASALFLDLFKQVIAFNTNQDEFSIILTFFNRLPLDPNINSIVAPFVSTNIFIGRNKNQKSLAESVKQTSQQILDDLEYSYVTGIRVIRELKREKKVDPALSLPVVFTSRLNSDISKQGDSFFNQISYAITQTPQILLDNQLYENGTSLHITWDVMEDYFPQGYIQDLFSQYCNTIKTVAAAEDIFQMPMPNASPKSLSILSDPENRYKPFPLTDLQSSYLYSRFVAGKTSKSVNIAYQEFEIREFDYQRFNNALVSTIHVNEMLKSTIKPDGTQVILKETPEYQIELEDFSNMDQATVNLELKRIKNEMLSSDFPLDSWPFFGVKVSLVNKQKAIIHLAVDMLIIDGESLQLFFKQLIELYENPDNSLETPDISFRDYVLATQALNDSQQAQDAVSHFSKKFAEIPSGPTFSLDDNNKSHEGEHHDRLEGESDTWHSLATIADEHAYPHGMVLLAAFVEVLNLWVTNKPYTIVVVDFDRLPVHPDINQLMGDFTSISWIVVKDEKLTFQEKIRNYYKQWRDDRVQRPNGGLKVLGKTSNPKFNNGKPNFPVVFTNLPEQSVPPVSGSFTKGKGLSITSQIELDIIHYQAEGKLFYNLDHIQSLLPPGMAEEFVVAYGRLLEYLASDNSHWVENDFTRIIRPNHPTDLKVAETGIADPESAAKPADQSQKSAVLSDSERNKILYEWNDTDQDFDQEICIHQLFEQQALNHPNQVATHFDGTELSYRELNQKANQLAGFLKKKGVGPEVLVGICLDRSHEMIIGLLAILKAGGAYVPLDKSFPRKRLKTIIEDAQIEVILTQHEYVNLVDFKGVHRIQIDNSDSFKNESDANPVQSAISDSTAYIIFTSGSTGKPKGVVVTHKPVVNLIEWMGKTFMFDQSDCVLFTTSLSFDLSVFDIFGMLAFGAKIHIVSDSQRKDFSYLAAVLCEQRITFWDSAPAAMHILVPFLMKVKKPIKNKDLRLVFLSGDWIPLSLPDDIRNLFSGAEVISLGGATEATVWSNYFRIEEIDPGWSSIPYGRPIQNSKYYILDENLEPCPVGEIGDLYIGGVCLSEGYHNAPELTEKSFIPGPFIDNFGGIIYKTGDLARFYPDGNIEFMGRVDHQVKIRGFRVELGEIEKHLLKHQSVKDVLVEVKKDLIGDQKIVAYIIPSGDEVPSCQSLRTYLAGFLPDYMLINVVIPIAHFPITANGKVDRKSLPDLATNLKQNDKDHESSGKDGASHKKETIRETTQQITELFKKLLNTTTIEAEQDLFSAGATSLTIVHAMQLINLDHQVEIPIDVILENPTIMEISTYIEEAATGGVSTNSEGSPAETVEMCCHSQPIQEDTISGLDPEPQFKGSPEEEGAQFSSEQTSDRSSESDNFGNADKPQKRPASIHTSSNRKQENDAPQTKDEASIPLVTPYHNIDQAPGLEHLNFGSKEISFSSLSDFLSLLKEEITSQGKKYLYPSAGGLYAVQTYVYIKQHAVKGLAAGIYYYQPVEHRLYPVTLGCRIEEEVFFEYYRNVFQQAGFCLFFIAQLNAVTPIYGVASEALMTLDTGYMLQLLASRQADYGIGTCSITGIDFDRISSYFELDSGHRFIHSMLGGPVNTHELHTVSDSTGFFDYLQNTANLAPNYLSSKLQPELYETEGSTKRGTFTFLTPEEHKAHHQKNLHLRNVRQEEAIHLSPSNLDERGYILRSTQRDYSSKKIGAAKFSDFLALLKMHAIDQQSLLHCRSSVPARMIKIYVYVKSDAVEGLNEGMYCYQQEEHALTPIETDLQDFIKLSHYPGNRNYYNSSGFSLFFVADLEALKKVFSSKSIIMGMLHSGHMGQYLMDKQAEFDIGLCPIGGMNFDRIKSRLHLNDNDMLLHSFVGGCYFRADRLLADSPSNNQEIAIIGISGRFPDADNLDSFWQNLISKTCSIKEIENQPWSTENTSISPSENEAEKNNWGAFLKDKDRFDSLHFNISPTEAQNLDPQERILLEVAWECLENAAYTSEQLINSVGTVGVFVGVMWNDYQNVGVDNWRASDLPGASAFQSSIANRLSYFHNFTGPSMAVDTSCASSLTAIHLAIESIKRGECNAALVGGVNLVCHPYHQALLQELNVLSKDRNSNAFCEKASGWIVGEGCSAILIRPLTEAERAQDHIHGVIKSSHISHRGKTTQYGRPNLKTQATAIMDTLDKSDVCPSDISYIETAATGAGIADATEINAIVKAFGNRTNLSHVCAFGSVKPNIGHLESASTMSQLAKVLMQMKHKTVAPTLLSGPLTPLIRLQGSSLRLANEKMDWQEIVNQNEANQKKSLIALINAYGATGSSGHLIVENYSDRESNDTGESAPVAVVLSAKSTEQLLVMSTLLLDFLNQPHTPRLRDIAFSLQVGRVAFSKRLALVCTTMEELKHKLRSYLQNDLSAPGLFAENLKGCEEIDMSTESEKLSLIAQNWVNGDTVDWTPYQDSTAKRVALPGYPFAGETHWFTAKTDIRETDSPFNPELHANKGFKHKVTAFLKECLSEAFQMPVAKIDAKASLEIYGINSIIITKINNSLKKHFANASKTLFFEYKSVEELVGYFIANHKDELITMFAREEVAPLDNCQSMQLPKEQTQIRSQQKRAEVKPTLTSPVTKGNIDIAIIGISARLPKAENLDEFWENLAAGKDCITEIPNQRWDYRKFYDEEKGKKGKTYSKWGGFISDMDKFDARFFNISPKEAEIMDPQERLFLQTAWETVEDAGYTKESIQKVYNGNIGVYVGLMYSEYQLFGAEKTLRDQPMALGSGYGSIANIVSYTLDLNGPSMAIDSMCSSSLTCVHLAVELLNSGACEAFIVGGVNLSIHPCKYLGHSQLFMSSEDGRCRSYGINGTGFVPGEGSVAAFLKPLSQAEKDNDHIYGVIKASAVNHGGHTSSYTVPNPVAQANLISAALKKSQIDPRTISYIEGHGTGTSLGDPIEISGLTKAFAEYTSDRQFCSIGSVKSNIGHLEAASGITGMIKVVLQMKHQQLVPSLHADQLNPNIDFNNTPFYVQQKLTSWEQPEIIKDNQTEVFPRRAGVSSFGAGGANAHVIIEEYDKSEKRKGITDASPQIILLSARNKNSLQLYAQKLKKRVETLSASELEDVAFTLQTGREAMDVRLAIVVASMDELKDKLNRYLNNDLDIDSLFQGDIKRLERQSALLLDGEEGAGYIKNLMNKAKLNKLARLWISGVEIDWNLLYSNQTPHRITLPTYPFAKHRFWIPESPKDPVNSGGIIQESNSSGEKPKITTCFYPTWVEEPLADFGNNVLNTGLKKQANTILIFMYGGDEHTVSHSSLSDLMSSRKINTEQYVIVKQGNEFQELDTNVYSIRPENKKDYCSLLSALKQKNLVLNKILHLWSLEEIPDKEKSLKLQLRHSFYSVFFLINSLIEQKLNHKLQLIFAYAASRDNVQPQYAAINGFTRTAYLEYPNITYKTVEWQSTRTPGAEIPHDHLLELIWREGEINGEASCSVSYRDGQRFVQRMKKCVQQAADYFANTAEGLPLKENGVYLITGGAGGLGLIFADFLAARVKAKLVLCGRSELTVKQQEKIEALKKNGAEIIYVKADVSLKEDVARLVDTATTRFKKLNGIIHSAGVTKDSFLLKKTRSELDQVISPKVFGTLHLDESTSNHPLDFFVLFSSSVSLTGNVGQCDYAYANSFMDHFAEQREGKRLLKQRSGKTLSINWPFWEEGGMQMPKALKAERAADLPSGLRALPSAEGVKVFQYLLTSNYTQAVPLYGDTDISEHFFTNATAVEVKTDQVDPRAIDLRLTLEKVELYLKRRIGEIIKMPTDKIDSHAHFENLGINSIIIKQFNIEFENDFGALPKTLLFEYQNLAELSEYFFRNHHAKLLELLDLRQSASNLTRPVLHAESKKNENKPHGDNHPLQQIPVNASETITSAEIKDIAIIGVNGRYPKGKNLDEFWQKLESGMDCVTEIPVDRWDYSKYYDPDQTKAREGKAYCKWGAFLDDMDKFDPLFFNISPKEAEKMDPQERLFIETAWSTLEDAGYTREHLKRGGLGHNSAEVGVFVGITTNSYLLVGSEAWAKGRFVESSSLPWSIANRVSFLFDFQGPSMPVDTACSSSLTAIHLACESLKKRECRLAIAGGVNLYLHPSKYSVMCASKMLSPKGRCHAFGADGNGFVPGEGVGAVLLKPLSNALEDHDNIYAVIKGTSVNHGGKTNGYTVPNPNAQAELIKKALEMADVDPRTISYLEAHGTGTSLGDPIEIRGLTKAFATSISQRDKQYCAIGSVKTNIGHLESAAGIAGLTKVLLQLRNKKLVPSLHSKVLNPNINFQESPFYVQQSTQEWNRPVITSQDRETVYPRRAGISSFGAGGANAHIIVEEFTQSRSRKRGLKPEIIVISAKNKQSLNTYIKNIIDFVNRETDSAQNPEEEFNFADFAYTLQVGREAMEERVSLIANDENELVKKLSAYINKEKEIDALYQGNVKNRKNTFSRLFSDVDFKEIINNWVLKRKYEKLAEFWVEGIECDWRVLHSEKLPRRMSLPTYPFDGDRYWIDTADKDIDLKVKSSIQGFSAPEQAKLPEYRFLEKTWIESITPPAELQNIPGKIVLVVNQETAYLKKTIFPGVEKSGTITIHIDNDYQRLSEVEFSMDGTKADQGARMAEALLADGQALAGFFDFSDLSLNRIDRTDGCPGKVVLLQKLLKNSYPRPFHAFHFTRRMHSFKSNQTMLNGSDFAGLIKMLSAEYSKVIAKTIDLDFEASDEAGIRHILDLELKLAGGESEICYRDGIRYVPLFKEMHPQGINLSDVSRTSFNSDIISKNKHRSVIITGGISGIGSEIARHLAEKGAKKLVLMGVQEIPPRESWDKILNDDNANQLNKEKIKRIKVLEEMGVNVEVFTGHLTENEELEAFFNKIRSIHGKIGGIIHCAGLAINDNPAFVNKEYSDMQKVFEPKMAGLETLHRLTQDDGLDFFILFSSVSSQIPDLATSLSDYAAANAYMDYFAAHQFSLGKTYFRSINWPSWQNVGMGASDTPAYRRLGFSTLPTANGLFLLDVVMNLQPIASVIPCLVNKEVFDSGSLLLSGFKKTDKTRFHPIEEPTNAVNHPTAGETEIKHHWLSDLFSKELKIPLHQLDGDTIFSDFGVDSIFIAEILVKIEKVIGDKLDPSTILEYPTLNKLSAYLDQNHTGDRPLYTDFVSQKHETENKQISVQRQVAERFTSESPEDGKKTPKRQKIGQSTQAQQKIAVIGIGCHFPGAYGKEAFWENLSQGKSSIIEIPESRWSIDSFYSPQKQQGKSISKWGGFIENIELFDPAYFDIKEGVAAQIDPLIRQFLEISVQTIRDSGYDKKALANKRVGVFVGSRLGNYAQRIRESLSDTIIGTGQNFIAALVSQCFNFKGPNLVVDSACSSSLVSIHLACQSLISGESEYALAGGVDILLDESPYTNLSQGKALSPDGKCHTFDEKANGFVPGEGCGAVFLKTLERAISDGDHIYAVIDSTATNNDGQTMGFTTPNPEAQIEVIQEAINKAGISPDEISYIEAHGTGTMIGDPIELRALTKVFRKSTELKEFCAIGSVKTNLGHLLSAAGIASFIKTVLSIHHKQIPPTLNCTNPNPRFDFPGSPFYPNKELSEWISPRGIRKAGISSFGFGGTNAHILVSEYDHQTFGDFEVIKKPLPPVTFHRKRYWLEKNNAPKPPHTRYPVDIPESKNIDPLPHIEELMRDQVPNNQVVIQFTEDPIEI